MNQLPQPQRAVVQMPYRRLGRTGEMVSLLGLGGFHVGVQQEEEESIRIVRTAVDRGVNFMDNCWDYNGGTSEVRMGKALRDGYRRKVFLMTKIDGRDRKTAASQLEESLRRLQTDTIDLVEFHEVVRPEDGDMLFAPGGGIEALAEARQAGKVRFIGFSGHKSPAAHLGLLRMAARHGFVFDAVQMPLSVMDAHFRSFQNEVIPALQKDDIGIVGMKTLAGTHALRSGVVSGDECIRYAMGLPLHVAVVGCESLAVLEHAVELAAAFRPYSPDERDALLARTGAAGQSGRFEPFKTTSDFDATLANPHWLGL
jgi:aryl-alcohol dehydrogenase-like predicted oxidoreductase